MDGWLRSLKRFMRAEDSAHAGCRGGGCTCLSSAHRSHSAESGQRKSQLDTHKQHVGEDNSGRPYRGGLPHDHSCTMCTHAWASSVNLTALRGMHIESNEKVLRSPLRRQVQEDLARHDLVQKALRSQDIVYPDPLHSPPKNLSTALTPEAALPGYAESRSRRQSDFSPH